MSALSSRGSAAKYAHRAGDKGGKREGERVLLCKIILILAISSYIFHQFALRSVANRSLNSFSVWKLLSNRVLGESFALAT